MQLGSFDSGVDAPATDHEINQWWSRGAVQLVGFTVAGHEGPEGVTHWLAVARNQAGCTELYRLCETMNDELPWTRMPGANVTCMTCLVLAAMRSWRELS